MFPPDHMFSDTTSVFTKDVMLHFDLYAKYIGRMLSHQSAESSTMPIFAMAYLPIPRSKVMSSAVSCYCSFSICALMKELNWKK
jgi:hypothetical protein